MSNINGIRNIPSSVSEEVEALSCILMDNDLIYTSPLTVAHFYDSENALIYEKMLQLRETRSSIDIPNLKRLLWVSVDEQKLYEIAGFAYTTSKFEERCENIMETYNRRIVISFCDNLKNKAYDTTSKFADTVEYYTRLTDSLYSVSKTQSMRPIDTFEAIFSRKQLIAVTETTWYASMDDIVRGYRAWSLVIIWARPSMWKSTFMLNLVINLQKQSIQTAIFSTEMPVHEIHVRVMSMLSKIESKYIEEWIQSVSQEVSDKVIAHSRNTRCNIYDDFDTWENLEVLICKEAWEWTKVIFLDYLQQVGTNKKYANRNEFIWAMTVKLKKLAIKYKICIVALSQLNRSWWWDDTKPPVLELFRDSGNIEQDADVAMVIHSYDYYSKSTDIHVLKNRHWAKWVFRIGYKKEIFYMYDI